MKLESTNIKLHILRTQTEIKKDTIVISEDYVEELRDLLNDYLEYETYKRDNQTKS